MKTDKATEPIDGVSLAVNEVRLVGRLSQDPEERVLPSGDSVWTFRLVVARPAGGKSRQRVDTLECAVWGGRVRKSAASWAAGDVVEVAGAMRRRFFSTGAGRASRVEVEVASGRMVRRAERHPSLSDRMSTPTLGLGWNDVAFSGSRRPACATRTTRSKSGAGISTATPWTVLIRVRASSTEWWKPTRRSRSASEPSSSSWRTSTAARSGGSESAIVAQLWPSVATSVSWASAAKAPTAAIGAKVADRGRLGRAPRGTCRGGPGEWRPGTGECLPGRRAWRVRGRPHRRELPAASGGTRHSGGARRRSGHASRPAPR